MVKTVIVYLQMKVGARAPTTIAYRYLLTVIIKLS